MLQKNLATLRKQKGMSQEMLARQLNVVRQTVSKWEKGLSVPDADMLIRIADLFDVSVSELLGDEITVQPALPNEQPSRKVRLCKIILTILVAMILIGAFAAIYPQWNALWREFGRNLYYLLHQ